MTVVNLPPCTSTTTLIFCYKPYQTPTRRSFWPHVLTLESLIVQKTFHKINYNHPNHPIVLQEDPPPSAALATSVWVWVALADAAPSAALPPPPRSELLPLRDPRGLRSRSPGAARSPCWLQVTHPPPVAWAMALICIDRHSGTLQLQDHLLLQLVTAP